MAQPQSLSLGGQEGGGEVTVTRILREPPVQFLLVGGVVRRLAISWVLRKPRGTARIASSYFEDDLKQIAVVCLAEPATADAAADAVDGRGRVREGSPVSQALALGLDRTMPSCGGSRAQDGFVAEDLSEAHGAVACGSSRVYDRNKARFALPARATFRHLYFSPDRQGTRVRDDAVAALAQLQGQTIEAKAVAGDPFMLQGFYGDRSLEVVAKEFGPPVRACSLGRQAGDVGRPDRVRVTDGISSSSTP